MLIDSEEEVGRMSPKKKLLIHGLMMAIVSLFAIAPFSLKFYRLPAK
jgi:hypothetical protein